MQNTNLYNNVPFGGQKVGSESSSTITSTTKSSVSGLNAGESWSNCSIISVELEQSVLILLVYYVLMLSH